MSSLKEKLDSKKDERATAERREIFTIIMQAKKKDLHRKFEESDKICLFTGLNLLVFLNVGQVGKR